MGGALHISHEEHHRALVRQLSSKVRPARPLWPVGARLGLWMVLEASVLAWVMSHTTNHFTVKLTHPVYLVELVFFAGAAIISAALALRSAIPGRTLSAREATIAGALVFAGTIVLTIAQPLDTSYPLSDFARNGLRCACETVILGALPWLALWWMVRRGASMSGWLSGLLVGAGALLFSLAVMRIACPIDEPLHLLTWHLLPTLAVIALSALAGATWLRFRPRIPLLPAKNFRAGLAD
jgi:hypothetical protein